MKYLGIKLDNLSTRIPVHRHGSKLWFHFNGKNHCYEIPNRASGDQENAEAAKGIFKASMPGKIMKVFIEKGQEVKQGQVLMVMEAMKMEYAMEASFDGTVIELNHSAGDQVSLGDLLVRIEKQEG